MIARKIGEILVEKGLLTREGAGEALRLSKEKGVRFGEACILLKLIDERQFTAAIAEQYGLEVIDIENSVINEEVLNLIPVEVLHRSRLVPVKNKGVALIATADPTDILTLDNIERMIEEGGGRPGRVAVAPRSHIEKILNRGGSARRILKEAADGFNIEVIGEQDETDEALTIEKIAEDSSPVVKLVDTILFDSIQKRASDIHLETGPDGLNVKYRIDGALHKVMEPIDKNFQSSIISRIKVMSELDISERRVPQDGRFKVRFRSKAIDFRVSIMPSVFGEDAVIRVLDKEHITRELEELRLEGLGFGEKEIAHLRKMIREPYGMVLVTGPTGSGKTTTLYAAISEINTGEDKIITIEDPVEYQLKGVVQIQVNEKKGLTFARGLRSILRHDPDKIMVGEIRDAETAQIAIQAALTGHLVFTTVHANNVFDVIGRFIHMGIEPYNFVSSLNCVLAQRLIRLVCQGCRRQVEPPPDALKESGMDPEIYRGVTFYEGAGCGECHGTGYRGRKAIIELLDLTDEIRDMIAGKHAMALLKKKAVESGMTSLRQAAIGCVLRGETTLKEINRVTFVE
ncbi:MAG: Flp pilus assembly complex ATPase component TadA [Deltaproteobacteria bacterium]|nr:Flp pilus assembly complex ATPase component TadA [Deltaproteobacteria bacterium]